MIKYIGSKRVLVPLIGEVVERLPARTACDIFAGTTRVGQGLRRAGLEVVSNDLATYSEALGLAYIGSGVEERAGLEHVLAELRGVAASASATAGYFTRTFCEEARYLHPRNGARVDAVREAIEAMGLDRISRGILLTALLEAADRVDSTTGLQMAYLKSWAPRAYGELELRMPAVVDGPAGTVERCDAVELAGALDVDLVYVDPPYNQHSYFSNYHVWETLVRWDAPEAYGVARKRLDCREVKSPWNSRRAAAAEFESLLAALASVPWMVVSFSNEGFHEPSWLLERLGEHGYVSSIAVDSRRYVGAQIGVFNPAGERVGEVSHLLNKELLFVVGPDRAVVEAAVRAGAASDVAARRAA